MDIATFEKELDDLIKSGCTEICANYIGDVTERKVLYRGCEISGTSEQYLRIEIEQPKGIVWANFEHYPNVSFHVSDSPNPGDLHVYNIDSDGQAAIINVIATTD